ncbi:GntR family transcriptional regulator [Anaeromassilibacillus sp. An200]|uniref:GntR family transcriptional regulator n=1 Tax=Candidatus Caccousia stercoris TaxID=2840723 RepID=A0A9D1FR24_9FIRM|nr:GntR family transcriptional regulator [Anaeromassilibacillus sp. An200]OUP12883.1 GntR family transcriptional regulator [Anaeromassilibacillus sp. An200]HIS78164.1 GntR family transcriptional regulator [Candidatus Caccousia stercoris]
MAWNLQSDRPIYAQLVDQIQRMIVTGIFPAGSRLPSVRELAAEAAVNPNTMQRALVKLEEDGLLYTQRTSGRYVTEETERIMEVKRALAEELIQQFVENMNRLGYTREQSVELLKKEEEKNAKSN